MATTVTSKGQVTIPKHVRDAMDIRPGTKIVFDVNGAGELILRKSVLRGKPRRPDRFERALGSAEIKLGCSTDEYMAMIRGYDDDDPGLRP
jgi:AbrB family looped-hinge helix DNA binding protein